MRIQYQSQKISFDGPTDPVKYINFNSALGLKLNAVTDDAIQRVPGNLNYIGTTLRYYNGNSWVILRDIRNELGNTVNKQDAASIGAGDFRSHLDPPYPLPSFYTSVVDGSETYRPETVTNSYLTVVGSIPTWKQWTSNTWPNGGDPDSLWGCHINFKTSYIRWGGNLTFTGVVSFSNGWNVGFKNNQLRVFNLKNPVNAKDITTKAYADAATESIATRTEHIFSAEKHIAELEKQLNDLYLKAKANTENPKELETLIEIVRKYQ